MSMEQEKEERKYSGKLAEIADRVEMRRLVCDANGFVLQRGDQDTQDLLDIVEAAFDQIDEFKRMAANVRHNNHNLYTEWTVRADVYDNSANYLSIALEKAVDKL